MRLILDFLGALVACGGGGGGGGVFFLFLVTCASECSDVGTLIGQLAEAVVIHRPSFEAAPPERDGLSPKRVLVHALMLFTREARPAPTLRFSATWLSWLSPLPSSPSF